MIRYQQINCEEGYVVEPSTKEIREMALNYGGTILALGLNWCGKCGRGMDNAEFIGHYPGRGNSCAECRDKTTPTKKQAK